MDCAAESAEWRMLDCIAESAEWVGLQFRPGKCATLLLNNWAPRHFVKSTGFQIGTKAVPVLKWDDHYRYLGCKLSVDRQAELKQAGKRYTKLKGLWGTCSQTGYHMRPKSEYIMRMMLPTRGLAKNLDNWVRRIVKSRVSLSTENNYFLLCSVEIWRVGSVLSPSSVQVSDK